MDRLTENRCLRDNEKARLLKCCECANYPDCFENIPCNDINKAINKLKQYEDRSEQRKKGKWLYNDVPVLTAPTYKCSLCGWTADYKSNYCENCGAEMEATT